jgi:hypothetical protein
MHIVFDANQSYRELVKNTILQSTFNDRGYDKWNAYKRNPRSRFSFRARVNALGVTSSDRGWEYSFRKQTAGIFLSYKVLWFIIGSWF